MLRWGCRKGTKNDSVSASSGEEEDIIITKIRSLQKKKKDVDNKTNNHVEIDLSKN